MSSLIIKKKKNLVNGNNYVVPQIKDYNDKYNIVK